MEKGTKILFALAPFRARDGAMLTDLPEQGTAEVVTADWSDVVGLIRRLLLDDPELSGVRVYVGEDLSDILRVVGGFPSGIFRIIPGVSVRFPYRYRCEIGREDIFPRPDR